MTATTRLASVTAALGLSTVAGGLAFAQERPRTPAASSRVEAAAAAAPAPMLSAANPLQCWWRSSAGAVRVGEPFDVTLTCAALDTDAIRAVPDESRLTVAAIQLMPFEIVEGGRAPELRAGDRRLIQHHYRLRIIGPDVIGHDVKLPPLSIPYKVESRAGAGATVAGRDLSHLMPQIAIRVVSQVAADADDIRDSSDASLARIDDLRFRARTYTVAGWGLAGIAALAALTALVPAAGVLRRTRRTTASRMGDRAVLGEAARVLDERLSQARGAGWTPEALAQAHGAMRAVAAIATGHGARDLALGVGAPLPAGRLRVRRRFGRHAAAVTAHVTSVHLTHALDALSADASARARARLEQLRDGLAAVTRAQYGASPAADPTAVDDAITAARDIARELARERLFSPRAWFRRPPATSAVPEF